MLTALCGILCAACIVISARRLGRLRGLLERSPPLELMRAFAHGRAALHERIEALRKPELNDFFREVFSTPDTAQAQALLNEHLLDLRGEIDNDQRVPAMLARVCLTVGVATMLLEVSVKPRGMPGYLSGLASLSLGAGSAVACSIMGRRADSAAKECRTRWNSLIRAVWRSLGSGDD